MKWRGFLRFGIENIEMAEGAIEILEMARVSRVFPILEYPLTGEEFRWKMWKIGGFGAAAGASCERNKGNRRASGVEDPQLPF